MHGRHVASALTESLTAHAYVGRNEKQLSSRNLSLEMSVRGFLEWDMVLSLDTEAELVSLLVAFFFCFFWGGGAARGVARSLSKKTRRALLALPVH